MPLHRMLYAASKYVNDDCPSRAVKRRGKARRTPVAMPRRRDYPAPRFLHVACPPAAWVPVLSAAAAGAGACAPPPGRFRVLPRGSRRQRVHRLGDQPPGTRERRLRQRRPHLLRLQFHLRRRVGGQRCRGVRVGRPAPGGGALLHGDRPRLLGVGGARRPGPLPEPDLRAAAAGLDRADREPLVRRRYGDRVHAVPGRRRRRGVPLRQRGSSGRSRRGAPGWRTTSFCGRRGSD